MGGKRTLIIAGAVVVAAIAAFANYAYLSSVQDRAYDNAERVRVFVVRTDIEKGLPGEVALGEERIESDEIPREFRPGTAITDTATIRGKVALSNLSVGQVVVDGMFVDPKVAQVSFAQRIPSGRVTVTVSIGTVESVAGLLVPGDKVNLIVNDPGGVKRYLYQNVAILAIGTSAAPQPGETQAAVNPGSNLITFAVPPLAATRILSAGGIYLSLVPPDYIAAPIPGVDPQNFFPPANELTP